MKEIIKILISIFFFVIALLSHIPLFFLLSYVILSYEVFLKAWKNILKKELFDENFLMLLATIGAFLIGEYEEAVAVMLFYQIGEFCQDYATDKSKREITSLMDIRPDYANIEKNGTIKKIDPKDVRVGDTIVVKPGEKIPLDGMVIHGKTYLDTKALTGESIPCEVSINSIVYSGSINTTSPIKIKVMKKYQESTASKILELVLNASDKKAKSEQFMSKFARIYTPVVVFLALLLALLPLFFFHDTSYIRRSLSFLVISCPCALVLSIPLSFFTGLGLSSSKGILVKGGNYLEALSRLDTIVFDKTGTLTEGVFDVVKIEAKKKDEILYYATYAESFSLHPISLSLKKAYQKEVDETIVKETEEITGKGIKAKVGGKTVLVGNEKLMEEYKIDYQKTKDIGTILYVAVNKNYLGYIVIRDKIKESAKDLILKLQKENINRIVMLTGDKEEISKAVAEEIGIKKVYASLLPQEKVEKVEALLKKKNGTLAFVGDGMNDAPVLRISDLGIAMGALGSDAAIEAADIVIMDDDPKKILTAMEISKKTMKIVKENIFLTLFIKILVLLFSLFGISSMWQAVFADVGVSLLAIMNACRMFLFQKKEKF